MLRGAIVLQALEPPQGAVGLLADKILHAIARSRIYDEEMSDTQAAVIIQEEGQARGIVPDGNEDGNIRFPHRSRAVLPANEGPSGLPGLAHRLGEPRLPGWAAPSDRRKKSHELHRISPQIPQRGRAVRPISVPGG